MNDTRYLNAKEAAGVLNISLPTLYAYVSRGLIRSEAVGGSKRNRRYYREDVEKLKQRKALRKDPNQVVEQALHFGEPVLASAITLITEGQLFYRGYQATQLAQTHSIEAVAQLIWQGKLETTPFEPYYLSPQCKAILPHLQDLTFIERFQAMLPLASVNDYTAYTLTPESVVRTGQRIMQFLICLTSQTNAIEGAGLINPLQQSWLPHQPAAKRLLNAALILCADHELNVSSFTARCVASASATPYAVVQAGLSALQGAKHGGNTEQVVAFLREVNRPEQTKSVIIDRLRRGDTIPGFGHPLYPQGDPRAITLLGMIAELYPTSPAMMLAKTIIEAMQNLIEQRPTLDYALAILEYTLQLPRGSGLALFALGRTVGWLGHAIEQYQLDQIIRPRARYTGVLPDS